MDEQQLLTISIVTFRPDLVELKNTLDSIQRATSYIKRKNFLITIIDNTDVTYIPDFLKQHHSMLPIRLIHGQGNIGFGRGHNLAFDRIGKFHLVLNPDVQLHPKAITNALDFMQTNQQCGLLSPYAEWPNGQRQYLCKRYPTVLDLVLRGFAPRPIQRLFNQRLARYEMQEETQDAPYWNPPIVSGCFMFFRSDALKSTGGFDDSYFLYFEDFDLTLRSKKITSIVYLPSVKIIHSGGNTTEKGIWHIYQFSKSAFKFFKGHGLKFL